METTTSQRDNFKAPSSFAIQVASMPWVFSQQHPLDTAEFIREAEKRGVRLDAPVLRELYRVGLLIPFITVTSRRVREPAPVDSPEPVRAVTYVAALRSARDTGRLRDLATEPYRPRVRFDSARMSDPRGWWNGHLYTWHQLLALPLVESSLIDAHFHRRGKRLYPRCWRPIYLHMGA